MQLYLLVNLQFLGLYACISLYLDGLSKIKLQIKQGEVSVFKTLLFFL